MNIFKTTKKELTIDYNHGIHSYPAKFPAYIPRKILRHYARHGDVVLDPFCGSGTTLVEASLRGLNSIGNDVNPIALLISKVKTTVYTDDSLALADTFIKNLKGNFLSHKDNISPTVDFFNKEHWFQKNVQMEIEYLLQKINKLKVPEIRDLLMVVLSEIIVRVSNQESDTRYAAIDKGLKDGETLKIFKSKYEFVREKIIQFREGLQRQKKFKVQLLAEDSRDMGKIPNDSVDMIITSPPYANTYDYYLYHKHRMNWLGYDYKDVREKEIGSRNEYSSRKRTVDKWKHDLYLVLKEFYRVLKCESRTFLIIGDSVVNGELIKINKIIKEIAENLNFIYEYEEDVLLSDNSRSFNKRFRTDKKKKEYLIILYKSLSEAP